MFCRDVDVRLLDEHCGSLSPAYEAKHDPEKGPIFDTRRYVQAAWDTNVTSIASKNALFVQKLRERDGSLSNCKQSGKQELLGTSRTPWRRRGYLDDST